VQRRREHLAAAGAWLWIAIAAPAVAAGAGASGGSADDVRRYVQAAARLYESLDYDQALEQLAHAKALGPRADEGVEISLYEGIIYADMSGHHDQSQAAFRAALLLRPDARLPVKVSPKVEREFEQLRKQVAQEQAKARKTAAKPPPVDRPVAAAPPPALVPAARPPPLAPSGPSLFGAQVPLVPAALGGVAVAAGVGATVFGVMTRSSLEQAQNATYQDQAYAHWQDANHTAPVANTLFVAAGVAAAGAVATYFLLPHQ
jgi:tetratricopeptide (TPR) repeat protein